MRGPRERRGLAPGPETKAALCQRSAVLAARRQRAASEFNFRDATGLASDYPPRPTLSWGCLCSDHPAWLRWSWGLWAHGRASPEPVRLSTWPLLHPRFLPWCLYLMAICFIPTKRYQFTCDGRRSEPDRLLRTVHYAVLRSIRKDRMCVNNHVFISL